MNNVPDCVVLVLSSWIGEVEGLESRSSKVPFFIGHGQADPMVPVSFGEKSHSYIKGLGNPVTFRTYPGVEHSCNLQVRMDPIQKQIEIPHTHTQRECLFMCVYQSE